MCFQDANVTHGGGERIEFHLHQHVILTQAHKMALFTRQIATFFSLASFTIYKVSTKSFSVHPSLFETPIRPRSFPSSCNLSANADLSCSTISHRKTFNNTHSLSSNRGRADCVRLQSCHFMLPHTDTYKSERAHKNLFKRKKGVNRATFHLHQHGR